MSRATFLRQHRAPSFECGTELLRRFEQSRDGNIAILFVFLLGVLMLFVGGAVDFTRANAVRADMVESMDAAGLAIAQIDALNGDDVKDLTGEERIAYLKEQGEKFFFENFKYEDLVQDLSIDFEITPQTITPVVDGKLKTLFLGIGERLYTKSDDVPSLAYLKLDTDTEITRRGSGKLELALVLDVTGSMASKADSSDDETKIESLRVAVDNLLQVLYDEATTSEFVKVGVVPFNSMVNPAGASSWNSDWTDEDAEAYYHGAHFFHTDKVATVDTSTQAASYASGISSTGVAMVIDPDRKVNHLDLYESHADLEWQGCVEARPYPLDELDTPPGAATTSTIVTDAIAVPTDLVGATETYAARTKTAFDRAPDLSLSAADIASVENSRWVPFFMPDEPNCNNNTCGSWTGSASVSYSLDGVTRNLTAHGYMFDDPDDDNDPSNIAESAYGNRTFIADTNYIRSTSSNNSSERFPRYTDVVLAMRYAMAKSYSEHNDYWDDVKALFEKFGANNLGEDEYIARNSYVGWWDEALGKYVGKYSVTPNLDETVSDTDGGTRGPNQDCPAPILPMTSSRTDVETHMETLFPYGNTNSANGMIWGLRVVSPQAPFTEGVEFDDLDWQKAIVLMTDGENVVNDENTHWDSAMTAYGFSIEERMGEGVDRPARGSSGFDDDRMADQIDEKLLRICYRAKQEGVLVYTIIFGLDNDSLETVFKACATQPGAPYYYKAPNSADLQTAFGEIAKDLVALHVSK